MVTHKKFNRRGIDVNPELKQDIANILAQYFKASHLTDEKYFSQWYICDADIDKYLYKCHYIDNADMTKVGMIRGTVVDIEYKMVVADFFGHTKVIQCDEVPIVPNNDKGITYKFTDLDGDTHLLNTDNIIFRTYFQGPTIGYLYWKGIVYAMTHRLLHGDEGTYNGSALFKNIAKQVGIPDTSTMFDTENSKFSPYIHYFIPVHQDVLISSKDQFDPNKGFAVYLMHKQMWNTDQNGPFQITDLNNQLINAKTTDNRTNIGYVELNPRKFNTTTEYPTIDKQPCVYAPPALNIIEVNNILKNGYYPAIEQVYDHRLGMGEAVAIYVYDDNNNFKQVIRLASTALVWRTEVRGTGPMLSEFYNMTTWAAKCKTDKNNLISAGDRANIMEHFPLFRKFNPDEIKHTVNINELKCWVWPGAIKDLQTRNDVVYMMWIAYLISVPIHTQKTVLGFYDDYIQTKQKLVDVIMQLSTQSESELELLKIPIRIKQIIKEAKKNAKNKRLATMKGMALSEEQLLHNSVVNFISKERGDSLYSLRGYLCSLNLN